MRTVLFGGRPMRKPGWRRFVVSGVLSVFALSGRALAQTPSGPQTHMPSQIELRRPLPTARVVVKQELDGLVAGLLATAPTDGEDSWKRGAAVFGLVRAYSAFGHPEDGWRLLLEKGDQGDRWEALSILATDGHVALLSDVFSRMPDSEARKCNLAASVADELERGLTPDAGRSFRARHGCVRPSEPVVSFPRYAEPPRPAVSPQRLPPPAVDRLRKLISLACGEPISVSDDCWFLHAMQMGMTLTRAASEAQLPAALKAASEIPDAGLQARVLWSAMMFLAEEDRTDDAREVFLAIKALAGEGKERSVVSELAIDRPLHVTCVLKQDKYGVRKPVIGGHVFNLGGDESSCGEPPTPSIPLSIVFRLGKAGHVELAADILSWFERTAQVAVEGMPKAAAPKPADVMPRQPFRIDAASIAIAHAYLGNPSAARAALQREDRDGVSRTTPLAAFWLALLNVGDTLPLVFEAVRTQSEAKWKGPSLACAWLRGLTMLGDVDGVMRVARLVETSRSAMECLAHGLWTASLNGHPTPERMAGVALVAESSFQPATPHAWAMYAATLSALGYTPFANRATELGAIVGIASYPDEKDDRYSYVRRGGDVALVWIEPLTALLTEMILGDGHEIVRGLLAKAPSQNARSRIVVRVIAALADRSRWKDVVALNTWADLSLASRASAKDSWLDIAQSYACAGDFGTAFQLIRADRVELNDMSRIVEAWKRCGRISGP